MAEVFAFVAGGVGVASLSIQLIEKVRKLSSFLKKVRKLPREIFETIIELEVFEHLLSQNAVLIRSSPNDCSETNQKVITICGELAVLLHALLLDIDRRSTQAKFQYSWTSIKATFKKTEVDELLPRLQRAYTLLTIVNQTTFQ